MSRIAKSSRPLTWLLGLLLLFPASGAGQSADLLTGVVTGPDSIPLNLVTIEALSLETRILRRTMTDGLGRFTILFPDGGGQYQMRALRIGLVPAEVVLIRYADEDRLVWNVQLAVQALRLEDIEVTAPSDFSAAWAETIFGRRFTSDELAELADLVDFNMLAMFADGIIPLEATDTTEAGISVGGLGPDGNIVTVDGLEADASALPTEGLESVDVVTNSYDVSQRGYGGAEVRVRTRGGTNVVRGSVQYSLHDPRLSFGGSDESPFGRASTLNRFSGGIGGPLIRNKLFINFSLSRNLRSNPVRSLTTATPTDLQRLGVAADSVARLFDVAQPLGLLSDQRFGTSQSDNRGSALLRLDYMLSDRHTLSVTGNWNTQNSDPARSSQLAFTDVAGASTSNNGTATASLTSQIGLQWSNEFKASYRRETRDQNPFLYTPQARVRVASQLGDGSTGITTLVVGGSANMPTSSRSALLQAQNQISWLSGGGGHRIRFGGSVQYRKTESVSSSNQLGTFTFNSLSDFELGTAASFRRTLAPDLRTTRSLTFALFGSDAWRPSRSLQIGYGLRINGASNPSPPAFNSAIHAAFGRRTDHLPSTLSISPSTSFTWTIRQEGRSQPALIVRGGVRLNQGRGGGSFVTAAQRGTGLADSEQEINCIGAAIPELDWLAYRANPAGIPTSCQDGTLGIPISSGLAPTATVFNDDYAVSKSLRTSLTFQRYLTSFLRASVSASYTRGFALASVTDLNLNTETAFQLVSEANRPLFVAPDAIAASTGAVRLTDSRIHEEFGQVRDVASHGISDAKQLTASLRGTTNDGITLSASYTWSRVRDRVTGLSGGNTAGNPNVLEWAPSGRSRTHAVSFRFGYPVGKNLVISATSRFTSGTPYTPLVGSDVNGDGSRNDRAFIFPSAAGTDPALAKSMQELLDGTSAGARRCLERQFGRIADRNSCIGPWSANLDLNFNYRPPFLGLDRKLSLSVQTTNLLRGLDDLFHGADNAHGWGMRGRPNSTLLFVSGFDQTSRQFQYTVNQRFGVTDPRAIASRPPFQLTISAVYRFGSDRRRDTIDRLRGIRPSSSRGRGRPNTRAPAQLTAASFKERLEAVIMNPAAVVLEMRDSLRLTGDQVSRVATLVDSAAARREALVEEVEAKVQASGRQDPRALAGLLRTMTTAALQGSQQDLATLQRILDDAQWRLLPQSIREGVSSEGNRRR